MSGEASGNCKCLKINSVASNWHSIEEAVSEDREALADFFVLT